MKQYKTVPVQIGRRISHKESYEVAVKQYAQLIDKHAVGGWSLFCIHNIPVTREPGCWGRLTGEGPTTIHYDMLIFEKED